MRNSFFLIIPEQRKDPVGIKLYEEVAIKQWVDELPVANMSLSTRLLHDFLQQSNKLEMSAQKRLSFLELLRACYLVMEDDLYSRLMTSGFPKSEIEHKIYHILVSIQKELAIAYWIVVKEQTRRELSWFQSKETALVIQRVIKGLSNIVLSQYVMNLPIHEWVWIDLHSLYKLGVKIKKESLKVTDDSCFINRTSSIQDSYKQIVLLSLADPTGLMPKEILQTYKFTELISGFIVFEEQFIAGAGPKCIIFQDEDQAAVFYKKEKKLQDEAVLYLNFNKLYKAFQKKDKYKNSIDGRYSTIKLSPKVDKLPIELLSYLEHRWHGVPLHGSIIFADRLSRRFVIGLSLAYALQNTYEPKHKMESEYTAESASEAALSCEFTKSSVVSVGSLISFRKAAQPEYKRSLGVVSKIAILKGGSKLNFEVNLLTEQAHIVTYSEVGKSRQKAKQKALIYNIKTPGEEEKSFLIVESFMLKEFGVVRLYLNEQNFPILLRERKNIGLGYWQFDCRRVEEQELAS